MKLNDIIEILKQVYNKYDNIRLGIAGSYANGHENSSSDIDVVIDDDLDRLAVENGLPINKYSAYKTVMQEVRWIWRRLEKPLKC